MFDFPSNPPVDTNFAPMATAGYSWSGTTWDRGLALVTPTLTALVPNKGPTNDPNVGVSVQGTGFSSTSVVKFAAAVVPATFVSATELRVYAPANATAGPVQVTVTNGTLVSNALPYTYETPAPTAPTLTSINPASGPINDGSINATLTGTNFTGTCTVWFDSTQAVGSWISATQFSCKPPVSSTAKTSSVMMQDAGAWSNAVLYTYISGVTVTDVQPNPAPPTSTGTYVNVYGTGFDASTWIQMNPSGPASAGPSYSTELMSSTHVRTLVNTWTMGQGTTWNVNATGSGSPDIVWQIAPYP